MKYLLILFIFITSTALAQVEIGKTKASITKIDINYDDTTTVDIPAPSFIAISESDSSLLVGNESLKISEIIKDSVTTYIIEKKSGYEYVYNENEPSLTQKYVRYREKFNNEIWFKYSFEKFINENEFEF